MIWHIFALSLNLFLLHVLHILIGQMVLVAIKNGNIGTHLRLFLQNPLTNWSSQTQIYAFVQNTNPLSQPKLSKLQIVFTQTLAYD